MARTKQTARRSTGGRLGPGKQLVTRCSFPPKRARTRNSYRCTPARSEDPQSASEPAMLPCRTCESKWPVADILQAGDLTALKASNALFKCTFISDTKL